MNPPHPSTALYGNERERRDNYSVRGLNAPYGTRASGVRLNAQTIVFGDYQSPTPPAAAAEPDHIYPWLNMRDENPDTCMVYLFDLNTRRFVLREPWLNHKCLTRRNQNEAGLRNDPANFQVHTEFNRNSSRFYKGKCSIPKEINNYLDQKTGNVYCNTYLFGHCQILKDTDFGPYQDPAGVVLLAALSASANYGINFGKLYSDDSNIKLNNCDGHAFNFVNKILDSSNRMIQHYRAGTEVMGVDRGDGERFNVFNKVGIMTRREIYVMPHEVELLRVDTLGVFFGVSVNPLTNPSSWTELPLASGYPVVKGFNSFLYLWNHARSFPGNTGELIMQEVMVRAEAEDFVVRILTANLPNPDGKTTHKRHIMLYRRVVYYAHNLIGDLGWPQQSSIDDLFSFSNGLGEAFFAAQVGGRNRCTTNQPTIYVRDTAAVQSNWDSWRNFSFAYPTQKNLKRKFEETKDERDKAQQDLATARAEVEALRAQLNNNVRGGMPPPPLPPRAPTVRGGQPPPPLPPRAPAVTHATPATDGQARPAGVGDWVRSPLTSTLNFFQRLVTPHAGDQNAGTT